MTCGSEVDEQQLQYAKSFIEDNDTAKEVLKRAVDYHRDNECEDCAYYDMEGHNGTHWVPGKDVSMAPYYIGAIKNSAVTNLLIDSNSTNILSLADVDAAEQAIKEVEEQPDEYSDKWAHARVQEANTTLDDILDSVEVTEEDVEMIENIVDENNALEYWHDYIAPDVKYRDEAKKAILTMLASPEDKYGNKGRINVFMYGESGTGKSVFKNFLKKEFSAVTIDGPRASQPDLTYNKKTDEMGKLPQAHKGILVVEEADEMDGELLGSTLTSFGETGRIEIRDMEIPAKARGVMLSNFESKREIINQWSPESLNRFDFTIHFERLGNEEKSDTLDWHYEHFRKPNPDENENILKKYIKIVRGHTPEIAESDEIKKYKDMHVSEIENIRKGISIMNVAWTIARLNLDDVKLKHYKQAFQLVNGETRDSALEQFR